MVRPSIRIAQTITCCYEAVIELINSNIWRVKRSPCFDDLIFCGELIHALNHELWWPSIHHSSPIGLKAVHCRIQVHPWLASSVQSKWNRSSGIGWVIRGRGWATGRPESGSSFNRLQSWAESLKLTVLCGAGQRAFPITLKCKVLSRAYLHLARDIVDYHEGARMESSVWHSIRDVGLAHFPNLAQSTTCQWNWTVNILKLENEHIQSKHFRAESRSDLDLRAPAYTALAGWYFAWVCARDVQADLWQCERW